MRIGRNLMVLIKKACTCITILYNNDGVRSDDVIDNIVL